MPTNITASVGKYGVNRSTDVKVIQGLLNLIPQLVGGPEVPLKIDGIVGPKTIGAITRFQNIRLGHADGKVDPHQQTLAQLDQLAPKDPKTQAEADKTQSMAWAMAAGTMLAYYDVLKLSPLPDPLGDKVLIQTALSTHFHLDKQPAFEHAFLSSIKYNYTQVLAALAQSATIFRSRTDAEAISDGASKDGSIYPAYTFFNQSVNFTQGFLTFGPLCRAAMVLHEPIHYVDSLANNTNDFYEHSAAYANITPQQAIHNPSSYVAFAQHVFYRKDERYGAGRPNE